MGDDGRNPVRLFYGTRRLIPIALEKEIRAHRIFRGVAAEWTDRVKNHGLLIDLSTLEWADIGCLARILLLVERALLDGIEVTVTLPVSQYRLSEQSYLRSGPPPDLLRRLDVRVYRRARLAEFLHHTMFDNALQVEHVKRPDFLLTIIDYHGDEVELTENELERDDVELFEDIDSNFMHEVLYENVFPFKWISKPDSAELRATGRFLSGIIRQRRRGISQIDAETLSDVILRELVQNVAQHAKTSSHSLIVAFAKPEGFRHHPNDYLPCESDFLLGQSNSGMALVEAVVGDSGQGIVATLNKAYSQNHVNSSSGGNDVRKEVAAWAFDRWSTRSEIDSKRGTRGLYRVDRVVQRYGGLVTIRTSDQLVGHDHSQDSFSSQISASTSDKLPIIPGSIVTVRLPRSSDNLPPRKAVAEVPSDQVVRVLRLRDDLVETGFTDRDNRTLIEALSLMPYGNPSCLVVIANDSGVAGSEAQEQALASLAAASHPSAVIVTGIRGSRETIAGVADSVNQQVGRYSRDIEEITFDSPEIWSPVLIVGLDGSCHWTGVQPKYGDVLNALIKSSEGLQPIRELIDIVGGRVEDLDAFRGFLRSNPSVFRINDGANVQLLVSRETLVHHISRELLAILQSGDSRSEPAVFRTPTLSLVTRWLNVGKVISSTVGTSVAMLALTCKFRTELSESNQKINMIVTDSAASSSLVTALETSLMCPAGIGPDSMSLRSRPGTRLVSRSDKVVVYADVIMSGASVRRCFGQIYRDGGDVVAVLCAVDARSPNKRSSLELWGRNVPVISVANLDLEATKEQVDKAKKSGRLFNISPVTFELEQSEDQFPALPYDLNPSTLQELVARRGILHFGHFVGGNGRHFTFYVDSRAVVEEVVEAVCDATMPWNFGVQTDRMTETSRSVEIWCPELGVGIAGPAQKYAYAVKTRLDFVKQVRTIERRSAFDEWLFQASGFLGESVDVIIIDWGAIEGSTLVELIQLAAARGAKRIKACIIVSQLNYTQEQFFRSLEKISVPLALTPPETTETGQAAFPDLTAPPEMNECEVDIQFISSLPIGSYRTHTCPVCRQLERMSEEPFFTEFIDEFLDSEQKRFRLQKVAVLAEGEEPVFVDGRNASSDALIWMLDTRKELQAARVSTRWRAKIQEDISEMASLSGKFGDGQAELPMKMCWLQQLLVVEPTWLGVPPLSIPEVRELLAKAAAAIAKSSRAPIEDRMHAIALLRTSSKYVFVSQFASVFKAVHRSRNLLGQLLYGALTYMERPYHQLPSALLPLRQAVIDVLSMVNKGELTAEVKVIETLEALSKRLSFIESRLEKKRLSKVDAWKELRELVSGGYGIGRHERVTVALGRLQLGAYQREAVLHAIDPEAPVTSALLEKLSRLDDSWQICLDFLNDFFLPPLDTLRDVWSSSEAELVLPRPTRNELDRMLTSPVPSSQWRISQLLKALRDRPEEFFEGDNLSFYIDFCEMLQHHLLGVSIGGRDNRNARLISILKSCPTDLVAGLKDLASRQLESTDPVRLIFPEGLPDVPVYVFCTDAILALSLDHLVENVEKYGSMNPDTGANEAFVRIQPQLNQDEVILIVTNRTPAPGLRRVGDDGRGLKLLRSKTKPFGVQISDGCNQVGDLHEFEVKMVFSKGIV